MVSAARTEKLEAERQLLEAEYDRALFAALRACRDGAWGLFKQNSVLLSEALEARLVHASVRELETVGDRLISIRQRLGYTDHYGPMQKLLDLQADRNANTLGEPRLAQALLQELIPARH